MAKNKSELKIAAEGKVGKLSVVGTIGWDYYGDGWSYGFFKERLKALGKVDTIEVEISSPGGMLTDAMAMMNVLIESETQVHTYVNAIAGSAASVLLMAGDKIFIPSNSMVFLHKPLLLAGGNADDLRKNADDLDKWENAMLAAYKRHFKGTDDELTALLKAETWLSAQEMADKFDHVTVMEQEVQIAASLDMSEYDELPKEVLALLPEDEQDADFDIEACIKDEHFKGFLKGLMAFFKGQKPEATTEQEEDMPLSKEEKEGLVAEITASVVEALKPAQEVKPEEEPETPEAKVAFEGDQDNPDAVKAHAEKLRKEQIKAAVNWSDPESVMAYHKAISGEQESEKGPNTTAAVTAATAATPKGLSAEQIRAEVDAVNAFRGITK